MAKYFLPLCGFMFAAFVASVFGEQICNSNMDNTVRGCDSQGCGYYGAPRGSGTHGGVDITCSEGSKVRAPFTGTILRRSRPYANNNDAYNDGLYIQGTGEYSEYKAKMFYFTPLKTSGDMCQGQTLGTLQSLQSKYPGITDHIHIQVYKNGVLVNPDAIMELN